MGAAGDRSGVRGVGGKQFVDQIVDRDRLKLTPKIDVEELAEVGSSV